MAKYIIFALLFAGTFLLDIDFQSSSALIIDEQREINILFYYEAIITNIVSVDAKMVQPLYIVIVKDITKSNDLNLMIENDKERPAT